MPIPGDDVARRPQSVTIEATGGVTTIGKNDTCRAVPGFHLAIVELVEGPDVRIDRVKGLPCRRNQDAHGMQHIHAGRTHHLEHIVQAGRVGPGQGNYRLQGRDIIEFIGTKVLRPRQGPVTISLDGVDFTVMRQKTKRLRQPPLRQGIGRETLVEEAYR